MEQTQAVERIANQFVYMMSQSMGVEFDKMGRSITNAAKIQDQCSRDYQSMEETAKELIAVNRNLVQVLDDLSRRQEELAVRLAQQESKLADTVSALDEELANQLYTFDQMRDLYEK